MKPTVSSPIRIRGLEYGGPKPLFTIPIPAKNTADLTDQAKVAADLRPDLVEWRADYFEDRTAAGLVGAAQLLRQILGDVVILFTLRVKGEGGAYELPQPFRASLIEAVLRSKFVDMVDLELASEPEFLNPLMKVAKECSIPVILAFHDFQGTPSNDVLLGKITTMQMHGADVAKIAVMPKTAGDVMRIFQVTIAARAMYPGLPLAIMSMGGLGSITRVAGFLYGSDMAFAVGKTASAPGQIPIDDARKLTEMLLRYS